MKRSERTKLKIIKATQEIVNEKGVEFASVREIAKKAEVNVASINYYFSKKENLLGEILLLNSEELKKCLKIKVSENLEELSIDELVLLIFDVLRDEYVLHLNSRKMLLDKGIMSSESIRGQADSSIFSPGHTLIHDFLTERLEGDLTTYAQRVALHLWGLIDQALFLVMGTEKDALGHGPSFIRESLKKTTQDFENGLNLK